MKEADLNFRGTTKMLQDWSREMPKLMGYDEAGGVDDFRKWQRKARRKLKDLLGFLPNVAPEPEGLLLEAEVAEGFIREQWALESPFGDHIFMYRLNPTSTHDPRGVILALHGHGYFGADPVAGVMHGRFGEEESLTQHNYDYGAQFARRGYLVYAPCQRGFAQRSDVDTPGNVLQPDPNSPAAPPGCSCVDINARAMMLGTSDIGMRVQDAIQIIDWIKSRPREDSMPLGCVGLSGGGHTTELLSAVDTRIKVASIQGYFSYWYDQVMDHTHCNCNYVPSLLKYLEQDDVCGLICPRPLLVTTADQDGVAPIKSFRRAYKSLKQIYRDQDADENLAQDVFEGGHEFSGRKVFRFFDKHLPA